MPRHAPRTLLAAVAALALTPIAAGVASAAPVPVVTSSNVSLETTLPLVGTISMEFARTGDYAYVSGLDAITVLDTSNPLAPKVTGTVVNALFENESMTYGERVVKGKLTRFVIAGIDLVQASPSDPLAFNLGGDEFAIVDVTDPTAPFIRSRARTTTSTHTVQCLDQRDCRYAYTAGSRGTFSILDLTDLDKPRQVATAASSAAAGNSVFARGAGHYWDFDGVLGWHTGSGGAQAFDVSDPLAPRPVTGTDASGRKTPYNDFILHNSMRPNAARFRPGAPPSVQNGNVLLVTEEDYANDGDEVMCNRSGSFQTWYIPDLDAAAYRARNPSGAAPDQGTVRPLDISQPPAEFGGGLSTPAAVFCSAHWFDVHQDGFVALGTYNEGLRILDVRDARNIKQIGYSTSLATETWDAYWVPQRDAAGVSIAGRKTNIVYTADAVRGIDVYRVSLPAPAARPASRRPGERPPATTGAPPTASGGGGGVLAATGAPPGLAGAGLVALLGAAWLRRRRAPLPPRAARLGG